MKRILLVLHLLLFVLCLSFNARAQNQTVMNGNATSPITFNNGGCLYHWTNTNPNIGLPATGGGNIGSFTAINTGSTPLTAYITATPLNVSYAYIASRNQNNVSVIDTETGSIIATIPVGTSPFGVAVTPGFGYVYVTNEGSKSVSVISTAGNNVIATIPVGNSPEGVAVSPDGSRVYVTNSGDNSVSVISTVSNSVITTIRGFANAGGGLIVSPDGSKLYIVDKEGFNVSVVSTKLNSITATIPLNTGNVAPSAIVSSPDGTKLYVTGGSVQNNTSQGPVFIISTATNTVSGYITINNLLKKNNTTTGVTPALALALNKDGSLLYFSYYRDSTSNTHPSYIGVANTSTGTIVQQDIEVGAIPQGISLSADESKIYVTSVVNGVSVLSTGNNIKINTIDIPGSVAFGNFIGATHCTGSPITYAITINPTPSTPTIITSGTTSPLLTNAGTASPSTSFTVSGYKLTAGIMVSPPPGFEISIDKVTFSPTVTIGTGGDIPATTVYVRLPAGDAVGGYSGNVALSSGTAPPQNVAVSGSVSPAGSIVPNQTVYNGQLTKAVTLPGVSCIDQWKADKAIGMTTGIGVKIPAFKAVNTGTAPITATITVNQAPDPYPWGVVWILNQLTGKVFMFHSESQTTALGAFAVGSQPYAMVIDKARTRIYITNKTTGTVSVGDIEYDVSTGPVLGVTVSSNIQVGKSPEGIVISPDGSTLFVANAVDGTVSVINVTGATSRVITTIPLAMVGPAGLAISPDGSKVYVANSGSGTVSVISTATNTVTGIIPAGANPQNLVVSPDGSTLYVTNQGANSISVISTANNSAISVTVGSQPFGIAISPDGSRVYVSNLGANTVSVVNTAGNGIIATVPVGTSPAGLTLNPDGTLLYVTNTLSGNVTVIATASNTVDHSFPGDNLGGNAPFTVLATGPLGCATPLTYTVTVLPTPPAITATGYLMPLTTSAGVPSATTSLVVTGNSLTAGITVTPPTGFEVSTDGVIFSQIIVVGKAGNVDSTKVYVRLADTTPPGTYSGDIVLSSPGATNINMTAAPSTVIAAIPAIIAGTVTGKITTCAGTPSANPAIQQFGVKGIALNGVLSATAPAGFEVSIDPDKGYAVNIDITNLNVVGKSVVYVRASAAAAGSISGDVKLTSPSAVTQYAHVYGVAYLVPTVNPISSQTVASGKTTKAVTFTGTGGNAFSWSNDAPGIGLAVGSTGDIAAFTAINTGKAPVVAHINVMPLNTMLAYTANQASNNVTVVNVATNQIIATIPVGSSPQDIWINADGTRLYVTDNSLNSQNTNSITVINTGNNKVIATVPVGNVPSGLSFSPDGSQIYVYNAGAGAAPIGTITTIDAATNNVLSTDNGNPIPRHGPVVNPKTGYMYIPSYPGGNVSVVDTVTNKTIVIIPTGKDPTGAIITPDGSTVYVTNGQDNTIAVINTATNKVTNYLQTDHFPADIVITPGTGCSGLPGNFTITVNPPDPTINASGVLDSLTTVYGIPSPTTTFTVSGTNLTEQILITPPPGFEVSTDSVNYSPTLIIGTGGDVPPTKVYIRLGAGTPVGTYNGDITLQSLGADDVKVPTAQINTVLPPKQTILVSVVTGNISACQGSASASPFVQQFKVTGRLLTGGLTIAAPINFEVSLDPAVGFTNNILLTPTAGSIGPQVVYVRSAASALGNIAGSISLKSQGAVPKFVPVKGNVTFTPTVKPVNNQVVNNGALTAAVNFTGTGNTYNWINDTPSIGLAASGGGNIAAFTAINTFSNPITATITVTPVSAPLAYIANSESNNVTVINTLTNQVVNTIPVGKVPLATVVSPDGSYIYVANQGSGTVSKINAVTGQVYGIPVGQSPNGIAISPDGSLVFVANNGSNDVSVISTASNGVFATIQVGIGPQGIIVSPDGTRLYVINKNATKADNIYVIDIPTLTVVSKIATTQLSPEGATISPDGATLYVSNYNSRSVSVINTATLTVTATITVGVNPVGLALSLDGKTLYVANAGSNTISVVNTDTNTLTGAGIKTGNGPQGVSVSPDGKLLYVVNAYSNSVTIINTATNAVTTTLATGGGTPVSTGNFISSGMGCAGIPTTFTITVNPTVTSVITAAGTLTGLSTTYGTPSVSGNFNVSGNGLTTGILVTPPAGFEVSTDNIKFSNTVIAGAAGTVGPLPVYIRLAATTAVGAYSGNIILSSAGAASVNQPMPNSTVNTTPLTVKADNKMQVLGDPIPVFTATYTGFVNGEGPAVLTTQPTYSTTANASSPAGKYPITVDGAASSNYSITYVPGVLTITTTETGTGQTPQGLVVPNTFTPNGDGINDTWNISGLLTYTGFTVQIFNRLGQNIFYSKDYGIAWDGTYNGAMLPVGTYYYVISFTGTKPIGGSVTIIR